MLNHVIISLFCKWKEHLTSFLLVLKGRPVGGTCSSQPSSYLTPWSGVPAADSRSASYKFVDSENSLPYSLYPVTGLRHQLLESTVYTVVCTSPSITLCKHVHIPRTI